jgi:23S rRNA pseudouridine955/2504/2580 synthase
MIIKVTSENYQKRLDNFIKKSVKEFPRSGMFRALRKGRILINGRKVKNPNENLEVGNTVEIIDYFAGEKDQPEIIPIKMDLKIIYEDQYILVIDKQKGIAVHPGAGMKSRSSLINGLFYYAKNKNFMPFLIHRLDKYASGVLITAKSQGYANSVGKLFKEKKADSIRKFYSVVVFGNPLEQGVIDLELDNQKALTKYQKISSFSWNNNVINLLDVEIITGRKHQIRRHLSMSSLPVAGDDEYGLWDLNKAFYKEFKIKEYMLHCKKIIMLHPFINKTMEFQAEMPEEIELLFGSRK